MMFKKISWHAAICTVVVVSLETSVFGQDLMITGILDATLFGGAPKVVEVYAINDISDLSQYALARAGNGAADFETINADRILPSISLDAGDFYYAVGNSFDDMTDRFDLVFPSKTGIRSRNFGVNSNGDDVTGLFFSATNDFDANAVQIDVVGELGVDGTDQAWEHLDSYLYSNNGRTPSTVFDVSDWFVPGINVLDNLTESEIADAFPDMTFSPSGGTDVDLDNDGDVDGADFLAIQRTDPLLIPDWEGQFGATPATANVSGVPEPASIALWGLAMGLVTCCRRR